MKILKLFCVLLVLIVAVVGILWVMNLIPQEMALDIFKKSGAVVGILFLVTLVVEFLIKPGSKKH